MTITRCFIVALALMLLRPLGAAAQGPIVAGGTLPSPTSLPIQAGAGGSNAATAAILSIQNGTLTITPGNTQGTATITSVSTGNSILLYRGMNYDRNDAETVVKSYIELTSATTVRGTRSAGPVGTVTMAFTVVTFNPGFIRTIQRGTITLSGVASNTATITAVNTAKSFVVFGMDDDTSGAANTAYGFMTLTNSTTVTFSAASSVVLVGAYQVVEFQ